MDGVTCPVVGSYQLHTAHYYSAAIGQKSDKIHSVEEIAKDNSLVSQQTCLHEWEVSTLAMIGVIVFVALAVIIAFKDKKK